MDTLKMTGLLLAAALLAACKTSPEPPAPAPAPAPKTAAAPESSTPAPFARETTQSVSATVQSIDHKTRMVTLVGADGKTHTLEASPEIRNLDQINTGDKVVVQYYEGLAAAVKEPGTSTPIGTAQVAQGATRAEKGEKPGAAAGSVVTTTVVIEAVDKPANTVAFTGPGGLVRTVEVKDPNAQKFISKLKKGDHVELTYSEALAVSVEPAAR